ncbi:hypothetical protein K450DRAFT_221070 [Umbelopsis ramanniana AG]|uniref:Uncharacterized protein n=1 Tax=Umbelopsis ramanniana AG TaxID=1314678 RepID=A0AAD5HIF2_UMBRA|nr:uncharacterized protein K450DRAFT_221070 [Umbelopsis ramanniana AG]KAI8584009.1 hypothetical protein K450DRAFT_221070 [Umbelopsis ramanniana AG]
MFNELTIPNSKHHCPDAEAVVECTQSEEEEWAGNTPEVVAGSNLVEVVVGNIGFEPGRIGEGEGMSSLCFPWCEIGSGLNVERRNAGGPGLAETKFQILAVTVFSYSIFSVCQEPSNCGYSIQLAGLCGTCLKADHALQSISFHYGLVG